MQGDKILATYRIESPFPPAKAAEKMAGEQSTGTFTKVAGETEEIRERFRAQVERVTPLETVEQPSLAHSKYPDSRHADGYHRAEVVLSFPLENVGPSLPNLLATVAGNLFELGELSGLRLTDLELPVTFADRYPGPQFGVEGTRKLTGVDDRPIIGTIVKPSVGLSPEQTADLVRELGRAGLDFVKDDELMASPPHSPISERIRHVMKAVDEAADETGKKLMYAFNITGEIEEMLRRHDEVLGAGGTCVMVSVNSVGLPGVARLRRHSQLPIHGHRNGWGILTRHPWLGLEFRPYQKLWRLAGVDHLHSNGLGNKFWEPDDSVISSSKDVLEPLFGGYRTMLVLSSAQWAGQAPEFLEKVGSIDVIYLCGGGILGHPGGVASGVASVKQGWEAAMKGIPLEEYARERAELAQALEKFR